MDLLTFILGIAALIIIHELGHFLAARLFGVEVEEFGIGFPPRAVKLFEHKGTIFSLNWIPLGGFVRPKGENDPEVPGGLAAASPWVRLGVLFAGPLMNLFTGVLLGAILIYSLGEPIEDKVQISFVADGSPAMSAGLQPGDLVLKVEDIPVTGVTQMQQEVAKHLGQEIALVVQRGQEQLTLHLTPRQNPPAGQGAMGVGLQNPTRPISFLTAIPRGAQAAFENARAVATLPVRMLSGQASPEEGRVVGYKGMYDIYTQIPSRLLFFMAISISLGVMNLLPIPALDGGRIVMILPEILFRKRVPAKYENYIHLVGFALLILLLIYVNVQDFINPIQLP
jgi:regulator of sigma E protease